MAYLGNSPANALFNLSPPVALAAGQTVVPINYTPGRTLFLLNGAVQTLNDDITATNGINVTLTRAAVMGDQLVAVNFASFSVAGALPLIGGSMGGPIALAGGDTGVTPAQLDNSTKLATTVGVNAVGPVVGSVRNAKMSVTAASASGTFTADEIIVETALGGAPIRLANYSQTVNLATTGVGGMDTGAAPASGYVALYAIYNPTTQTSALLARNAATLQGNVYGGANMPSGYTASALVGVWPTNASSQFIVGVQIDRRLSFAINTIFGNTTQHATFTSLSIAGAVPLNAKRVWGSTNIQNTPATQVTVGMSTAADANGSGQQFNQTALSGGQIVQNYQNDILTPQTLFYVAFSNPVTAVTFNLYVTGYEI
jgi:hypothetical protein